MRHPVSLAAADGPSAPRPPATPTQIAELRAEARYARERYDLYQAKMYGLRPTTVSRLDELDRAQQGAAARLSHAEASLTPISG